MFQKHQLKMLKILIQTVCYSGKEEEGLTETRVRLYKQMETKSFQFLPPDEKSILQAIKLIHFEVYYWSRVDKAIINEVLLQDIVWIVNNENEDVCPL